MYNYLLIIILILAIDSQAQTITINCRESDDIRIATVPLSIKIQIDSVFVSKTGEKIYKEYFLFDSLKSGLYPGNPDYLQYNKTDYQYFRAFLHYNIYYDFVIPEKPWQRLTLIWYLDSLGNIIEGHYPEWLPNCIHNPSNCTFGIDSLEAISIAKLNGIPLDKQENIIAELSTERGKDGVRIVWAVTGYTDNNKGTFYYIDINTGEVIKKEKFITSY